MMHISLCGVDVDTKRLRGILSRFDVPLLCFGNARNCLEHDRFNFGGVLSPLRGIWESHCVTGVSILQVFNVFGWYFIQFISIM